MVENRTQPIYQEALSSGIDHQATENEMSLWLTFEHK